MEPIEIKKDVRESEERKIMTGSRDLNIWLLGGYEKGVITLFYGPPASGKSNLTMLASCYSANKEKKVLYIDTEGSFSLDRIKQIAGEKAEAVLKNIIIIKPINFFEQKKALLKILNETKSKNISLIVIDSMTMLYRLELAEARKKGLEKVRALNNDMANQMKALYEVARKMDIPVLITAQVYSDFLSEEDWLSGKEAGVSIVGGDLLKYWSKCIIELQNKGGKKRAIIRKHRSLPEKELNFVIVNEGVMKRGWL